MDTASSTAVKSSEGGQSVRRRGITIAVLGSAMLGACAAPPGGDLLQEVGRDAKKGTVALVVWAPETEKRTVWLQFAKRSATGPGSGLPVSVLVAGPTPNFRHALPVRSGWRGQLLVFDLAAGPQALHRCVLEIADGSMAVSPAFGLAFDVSEGGFVHLGHIDLQFEPSASGAPGYRLGTTPAAGTDLELVRRNVDAVRSTGRAAGWSLGSPLAGTTSVGNHSRVFQNNSVNLHIP